MPRRKPRFSPALKFGPALKALSRLYLSTRIKKIKGWKLMEIIQPKGVGFQIAVSRWY
jgi:hypothetical protein